MVNVMFLKGKELYDNRINVNNKVRYTKKMRGHDFLVDSFNGSHNSGSRVILLKKFVNFKFQKVRSICFLKT